MYTFLIILSILLVVAVAFLFRERQYIERCVTHNVQTKIREARDFLDFHIVDEADDYIVFLIDGEEWRLQVSKENYNYAVYREEDEQPVEAYVTRELKNLKWFLTAQSIGTKVE